MRKEILQGDAERGRRLCGFDGASPIVLIVGGSSGSEKLNQMAEAALPDLVSRFQVVHVTGRGKKLQPHRVSSGYKQFEFTNDLHHLLAMADLVVSRAGATAVAELLVAKKLNILVPLSCHASRGEQIKNADYCSKNGASCMIYEEHLSTGELTHVISEVLANRPQYSRALARLDAADGSGMIFALIAETATASPNMV